jgi:hypothetical protein
LAQTDFGLIKGIAMDATGIDMPGDPIRAGDQSRNVATETESIQGGTVNEYQDDGHYAC